MKFQHKLAILFAFLWFFALLSFGLFLSQLDHPYALQLFASSRAIAHQSLALRLTARDLKYQQNVRILSAKARLSDGEKALSEQALEERAGEFLQGNLQAPDRTGEFVLHVDALLENQIELHAEAPIAIDERPHPLKAANRQAGYIERNGPILLELYATDGAVSSGLPSRLTLRSSREGLPVSQKIALQIEEGRSSGALPGVIETGPDGLAELNVTALTPTLKIQMQTLPEEGEAPSEARPHWIPKPTQFVFRDLAAVQTDTELRLDIQSLYRQGVVFIDLFYQDRWLYTHSAELTDNRAQLSLSLPRLPEDPAILWVQAYRSPYLPGEARASRHLLATQQTPQDALNAFLLNHRSLLNGLDLGLPQGESPIDRQAALLLSELAPPTDEPPLLCDSSQQARQELLTVKTRWQNRLTAVYVVSSLILIAVILIQLRKNKRKTEQQWSEFGEEGEQGSRRHNVWLTVSFLLLLITFLLGVLWLFRQILWK